MDGDIRIRRIGRSFTDVRVEREENNTREEREKVTESMEETEPIHSPDFAEAIEPSDRTRRWNKIGAWCMAAIVGLAPIFFLPLTVAPVEISKIVLVLALTVVASISFLITVIESRRLVYPKSGLFVGILVLLGAVAISTAFSKAKLLSWHGGLVSPDSLNVMLGCAAISFLAFYFLRRDHLPFLLKIFLGSTVVATLFGLAQAFGKFLFHWDFAMQKGFTTLGSISGWGVLIAAALSILTVLPMERLTRRQRLGVWLAGLVFFIALVIINYQLLWMSLALLMIIISAARFVAKEPLGWPIIIAVLTVFLALVSPHLPQLATLPVEIRPNVQSSWNVAEHSILGKRILVGSGPATYGYDYSLYRPRSLNQSNFWGIRFDQGYNYLLTALANIGLLGVLAILLLGIIFVRIMLRSLHDKDVLPLSAGILSLMIAGLFFSGFFVQLLFIFIGLGLLAVLTAPRAEISLADLSMGKSFLSFLAAILLVAISLSGLYFLGQRYYAAVAYGKGVKAFAAGDVPGSIQHLQAAVQWDGHNDQYWRAASQALLSRASQLAAAGTTDTASQSQVQQAIAAAVDASRRATTYNPNDSLNWSNAGSIYENLIALAPGADQLAIQSYQEAMKRDPQNPQEPVNVARASIIAANQLTGNDQKDKVAELLKQAESFLNKSLELKSDYATAHYLMAQLFLKSGNVDAAVERTEAIQAANPLDAGVAFQLGLLYYGAGAMSQAQTNLERAVNLSADYANARYFLGLVYDKQGNVSGALAQFRRVLELNPDNAEVKRIIGNLEAGRHALQDIVPPAAPPESRPTTPVTDNKKP